MKQQYSLAPLNCQVLQHRYTVVYVPLINNGHEKLHNYQVSVQLRQLEQLCPSSSSSSSSSKIWREQMHSISHCTTMRGKMLYYMPGNESEKIGV